MTDKPKIGRPKKSTQDKAVSVIVQTRLKTDDYEAFLWKINKAQMSESAYLRDCVIKNKTKIVVQTDVLANQKKMLFLLNKLSNNVNQLAYRANADHARGKLGQGQYESIVYDLNKITQWAKGVIGSAD